MATRMQQRRGTAAQWISSNGGDGPILNAGEIGWESDTNKFKIGDGVTYWDDLKYFVDAEDVIAVSLGAYLQDSDVGAISGVAGLDASKNLVVPGTSIIIEGATADAYETTLTVVDPTAARTITFPNATGTVAILDATQTFTNKTLTSPKINEDVAVTATATELNYVDGVTSAIQTQIDLKAPLAAPAFTGAVSGTDLTLSGNLTVNGTTTNINSTNLVVEDKNVILGDVATPTDTTADGGGITLKGATDKTLNWVDATDAWTSSENFNLLTGKVYEINGTSVLSGSTLGSGVTGSSLTSVGTITSGTWNGTTIAIANGGTGATTAMTAATPLLPDQASNSGKYLTNDGSGTLSWGTVTGYSAPTLGSTSIASGATVTTIVGLTKVRSDVFTTLDASGYEVDLETMQIMGAL
jgi:hypothetical protein